MKEKFIQVAYWLHITDGKGQLDIVDLSFILLVGKLMCTHGIDWGAICTLIPIIAQQMHTNHIESKAP